MFQFAFTAIVSLLLVTGVSIAWPRFSPSPLPAPLSNLRSIAVSTPLGKQAETVLGVSSDSQAPPVNPGQMLSGIADSATNAVKKRAAYIIANQAIEQFRKQYGDLPEEQKDELRTIICSTDSGQPSAK
jgi:hypothetical protein